MRATSKQAGQPGELEAARWLFANSLDLFVVLDGESIVRINPAWTSVTGWQEADVVGRPFLSFTHPEDLPTIEAGMAAVLAQGDGGALAAESADLIYHWLVVLAAAGVSLDEVAAKLEAREGTSGLDEKAARRS